MHWWADLWDNWARTFGYERWEWGSASDAFAAIGTVGALAVTLHIIRKDRREKVEEQARAVVGWFDLDQDIIVEEDSLKPYVILTVTVHNSSARPITALRTVCMTEENVGIGVSPLEGVFQYDSLLPDHSAGFSRHSRKKNEFVRTVLIRFYDSNGVHWSRDLKTQELRRTDGRDSVLTWREIARRTRAVWAALLSQKKSSEAS